MKKIANNLDVLAKTAYTVSSVFVWVLSVCAVLLLIFGEKMVDGGATTVTLGALCFEFAPDYLPFEAVKVRMVIGLLSVSAVLVFVCFFIHIIRDVLRPMKEGKPFEAAVSNKLRRLSWITLIGGGVLSAAKMIGEIILYRVYDLKNAFINEEIIACTAEFKLDMTFVVVFVALYLLSYIFRYGEKLQKQADETL